MSSWGPDRAENERFKFWNTAPADPIKLAKNAGGGHFNRVLGRVLMPQSHMPVGEHLGKIMENVPIDYLLWVDAQPWAERWGHWEPVRDYIQRHPDRIEGVPDLTPVIFVEPHRRYPTKIKCFQAGSAHLHTLPGHEDKLHAFAAGACGLNPQWYQRKCMPHYDVTVGKHALAIRHGATLITDKELVEHMTTWRDYFQTKPKPEPLI